MADDGNGPGPPRKTRNGGWVPVPDPTTLTTEAVERATSVYHRELAALRELIEQRLTGMDEATRLLSARVGTLGETLDARSDAREKNLRALLEQRLDGMDRATELVAQALQAFRAEADVTQRRQREATTAEIAALSALLDTRLNAMDKATELLAATVGRVPSDTDKQVNALRELLGARIDGMDIATELLARNVREVPSDIDKAARALREILQGEIKNVADVAVEKFLAIDGTFSSNALALTAALAAQKEAAAEQNKSNTLAITKSEVATKEKIDSNAQQTATSLKSLADRLDDLKERVDRGEGQERGQAAATGTSQHDATFNQNARIAQTAQQRALISSVISGLAVLVSVISVVILIVRK